VTNFYLDNPDLRRRVDRAPWETIAGVLAEQGSAAEAREQIGMVLDLAGRIAAERIAPHAAEVDRVGARLDDNGNVVYTEPTRRAFETLAEAGLMGLTLPGEFGGMDLPTTAYTAVVEIISRADASLMTLFALQGCGETIHRFGSHDLHERYLPGLASGEMTACMALTEPDAGSALDTARTRAIENDDGTWRIQGSKCFITNGGADVLLVLARSEEDQRGAYGLSLFVVEKGEGVEVSKLEEKLGIHGSPTAVLNFDDAPARLLGNRGGGLQPVALSLMNNARLEVAAQAVGIAQAAQVQAVAYAHERKQRRRTIDRFPPVRAMLFENAVQIEAARAIIFTASATLDRLRDLKRRGEEGPEVERLVQRTDLLTPLAKYYASEMVNEVASRSLQVHGGYGYMTDYPVERHFRDARITSIYEGTSQIQVSTMIGPIFQGGLAVLFEEALERTAEPASCGGVLDTLRTAYASIEAAAQGARHAGAQALQGWARQFADAIADLTSGLVFLADAADDERASVLARHQARAAARRARRVRETVEAGEVLAFDNETYAPVVDPYRSPEAD
jgi:alkylation response protein AidB-like acyl-CoA dehydrogenase